MSQMLKDPSVDLIKSNRYLLGALVASFPLYFVMLSMARLSHIHEDEAVAVAASMCFLGGVFVGRYVALPLVSSLNLAPRLAIVGLVLLISLCFLGLLVLTYGPFGHLEALSVFSFWTPILITSLAIGALIKLIRLVVRDQLAEAQTLAAHSKSELHLLQSQLSPHFLFNTLNNLYGLSIAKPEQVPALLLKLSNLLRYSVYDANELYVPLKEEVAYINNYIDFEKIRIGDRLVLNTSLEEIVDAQIKIAPMLLITFIENAFKHAKNTAEQQLFVTIELKTWGDSILFLVSNSYDQDRQASEILDKHSGLGLANVHKRLNLMYHKEHELSVTKEGSRYTVTLRLKKK